MADLPQCDATGRVDFADLVAVGRVRCELMPGHSSAHRGGGWTWTDADPPTPEDKQWPPPMETK